MAYLYIYIDIYIDIYMYIYNRARERERERAQNCTEPIGRRNEHRRENRGIRSRLLHAVRRSTTGCGSDGRGSSHLGGFGVVCRVDAALWATVPEPAGPDVGSCGI